MDQNLIYFSYEISRFVTWRRRKKCVWKNVFHSHIRCNHLLQKYIFFNGHTFHNSYIFIHRKVGIHINIGRRTIGMNKRYIFFITFVCTISVMNTWFGNILLFSILSHTLSFSYHFLSLYSLSFFLFLSPSSFFLFSLSFFFSPISLEISLTKYVWISQ